MSSPVAIPHPSSSEAGIVISLDAPPSAVIDSKSSDEAARSSQPLETAPKKPASEHEEHKLGLFKSTAISGNDLLASVLYTTGGSVAVVRSAVHHVFRPCRYVTLYDRLANWRQLRSCSSPSF